MVGLEDQIREIFGVWFPGGADARECISRFLGRGCWYCRFKGLMIGNSRPHSLQ